MLLPYLDLLVLGLIIHLSVFLRVGLIQKYRFLDSVLFGFFDFDVLAVTLERQQFFDASFSDFFVDLNLLEVDIFVVTVHTVGHVQQ